MILGQLKIKKHGVIIDIIKNFLAFGLGHCIYIRAFLPTTLSQLILPTKIVSIKIEKDITLQKIIKKSLMENMTDFLQVPNKLSNKKGG